MSDDIDTGELMEVLDEGGLPAELVDSDTEDFAQQIADSVASFLLALREIAREGDAGRAIPLLLLEITQISLAGARLGAQRDFTPRAEYQPDVGPESDLDEMRMRLAEMLDSVDTYSFVFDPYLPEVVESQLSDDLASIAVDLDNGLRHFKLGDIDEALWWWQFSYVSSWGAEASGVLRALQSIVAHDRLDTDADTQEMEQMAIAEAITARAD